MAISPTISPDALMSVARSAAGEHVAQGTDLSAAVVKHASASGLSFTDEHVRRICEMTYHEAFERLFHTKRGSLDRYVSFDPPDAAHCAQALKAHTAEKVASAPSTPAVTTTARQRLEKTASAVSTTEKYQPRNAFLATVLAVDPVKVASQDRWHNPMREITQLTQALREAHKTASVGRDSAEYNAQTAMLDLVRQADQACKEGAAMGSVLEACMTSVPPTQVAGELLTEVASYLAGRGYAVEGTKVGSAGDVNPAHPLPRVFAKVAGLREEFVEWGHAVDDLQRELRVVEGKLRAFVA